MVQVVRNLEKALKSEDPAVDQLFYNAFSSVVLDPKYVRADEALHQVGCVPLRLLMPSSVTLHLLNLSALQEHMQYISLLGELQESIRARIGQGLVNMVSPKPCDCFGKGMPELVETQPAVCCSLYAELSYADQSHSFDISCMTCSWSES